MHVYILRLRSYIRKDSRIYTCIHSFKVSFNLFGSLKFASCLNELTSKTDTALLKRVESEVKHNT